MGRIMRLNRLISDWFGTKRTFVWFQINRKMVNTIWFRFHSISFRKDFSMCTENCNGEFHALQKIPAFTSKLHPTLLLHALWGEVLIACCGRLSTKLFFPNVGVTFFLLLLIFLLLLKEILCKKTTSSLFSSNCYRKLHIYLFTNTVCIKFI